MTSSLHRDRGFTLIELMIVVAILAILAAVAVVGYGQYVKKARNAEATSILADIRLKQEAYRATFHQYADLSDSWVPADPAPGVVEMAWPTGGGLGTIQGKWRQLGVTPDRTVYFRYFCEAGVPGVGPDSAAFSDVAADMVNLDDFWFAAIALQDFDEDGLCEGFEIYNGKGKIVNLNIGLGGWDGSCE